MDYFLQYEYLGNISCEVIEILNSKIFFIFLFFILFQILTYASEFAHFLMILFSPFMSYCLKENLFKIFRLSNFRIQFHGDSTYFAILYLRFFFTVEWYTEVEREKQRYKNRKKYLHLNKNPHFIMHFSKIKSFTTILRWIQK